MERAKRVSRKVKCLDRAFLTRTIFYDVNISILSDGCGVTFLLFLCQRLCIIIAESFENDE